jgi:hypothetical protein
MQNVTIWLCLWRTVEYEGGKHILEDVKINFLKCLIEQYDNDNDDDDNDDRNSIFVY